VLVRATTEIVTVRVPDPFRPGWIRPSRNPTHFLEEGAGYVSGDATSWSTCQSWRPATRTAGSGTRGLVPVVTVI
jgi:hypothetical protein